MTQAWIARLPSFGLTQLISFEMVVASAHFKAMITGYEEIEDEEATH